ncbi:hypothetical protein HHI36_018746 [Cryptolaemus montrouzieri]|uniref:Ionotropic receptor n=1 Tax=Cryptolaemus montrouzieri TaxID=559131 RepID=A0ABD2P1K5_9CUCU
MLLKSILEPYAILNCLEAILKNELGMNSLIVASGDNIRVDYPIIRLDLKTQPEGNEHLFGKRYDAFIIEVDPKMKVNEIVNYFEKQASFYRTAKFIFVGNAFSETFRKELASNLIRNVIFLNNANLEISTYFPYRRKSLQNIDTDLQLIGHCTKTGFNISDKWKSTTLFLDNIPEKWNNSTLKVLPFYHVPYTVCKNCENRGIEIKMMDNILKILNITPNYTELHSHLTEEAKYDLSTSQVILGTGFMLFHGFRHTVAYTGDDVIWIVGTPSPIPKWKYIYKAFSINVWAFCIFILILVSFTWYAVNAVFIHQKHVIHLLKKPFLILNLFLEQSADLNRTFISQFVVLTIIIIFTFLINAFYKSRFTYLLTGSGLNYENGVETYNDIMKHELKTGYYPDQLEFFSNNPNFLNYMTKHFYNCQLGDPFICTNRTAFIKDIAVLRFRKAARFYLYTYFTDPETGKPLIREVQPVVQFHSMSLNVLDGHPIFLSVDKILRNFTEHGILNYIMHKYDELHYLNFETVNTKKITFSDMSGVFMFCINALLISTLVFALERRFGSRN